jgi:hypothetical protein
MLNRLKAIVITVLSLFFLTGCITSMSGSTLTIDPIAPNFASMPADDAAIATAVAVQAATPPLQVIQNVSFANGALGLSNAALGQEGFEFTGSKLYTQKAPQGSAPGVTVGEVELTDPLERKATLIYRAEYNKNGEQITLTKLHMEPSYTATPRINVTLVPATDLPKGQMTYTKMIEFLAEKGLSRSELSTAGKKEYAIVALGKDWALPSSKMTIAISAKKNGSSGHSKGSGSTLIDNQWPVAIVVGTFNPSSTKNTLYAKVVFKRESGFTASKRLGTYQLSAFK